MFNLKKISLFCFVIIGFINLGIYPAYADVYKWKDSEGQLRYSDTPPRSDIKFEVLSKKKEASATDKGTVTKMISQPESQANLKTKNISPTEQSEKLKKQLEQHNAENLSIDEENCVAAKSNLATYQNGGRIKRINEKSELVFMSDAEIQRAKEGAQKDVTKFCKT